MSKRAIRDLAREGFTSQEIASITGDLTAAIEAATVRTSVDPELVWAADRARMDLHAPTKELFVRLFAQYRTANDGERKAIRTRIILESTNVVRNYVAEHATRLDQAWEFSDLESTATIAVIEEVDRLLAKNIEHANPGSMIIEAILATIYDPNPDLHSRPYIVVKPRGEKAKHVRTESPWPEETQRDSTKHFGERVPMEFGTSQPAVDDRWELLGELCDEQEMTLLDMLAQGYTHAEAAKELGCHVSTITKRLRKIREKVQRQRERDGDV